MFVRVAHVTLEESECFHYFSSNFAHDLVLTIQWRPDCRSPKQKRKNKPITTHVPMLCDWPSSSASACDSDNLNDGVVSGIRTLFSLDCLLLHFWLRLWLRCQWKPAFTWQSFCSQYRCKCEKETSCSSWHSTGTVFRISWAMLSCRPLADLHYDTNILTLDIVGEAFLIFFFFVWSYSQFHSPNGQGGSLEPSTAYATVYTYMCV